MGLAAGPCLWLPARIWNVVILIEVGKCCRASLEAGRFPTFDVMARIAASCSSAPQRNRDSFVAFDHGAQQTSGTAGPTWALPIAWRSSNSLTFSCGMIHASLYRVFKMEGNEVLH